MVRTGQTTTGHSCDIAAADPDKNRTRATHSLAGKTSTPEFNGHCPRRSIPVAINACHHAVVGVRIRSFGGRAHGSGGHDEGITASQHRPGHACILGGDGHHGLPVAPSLGQNDGPAADRISLALGGDQNGPGTEDQQRSQVSVAGFGDASQSSLAAGVVLPGHQTQPGGELSATTELMAVSHHGDHARSGRWADATQTHELARARVGAGHDGDVAVVSSDSIVQPMQFAQTPLNIQGLATNVETRA